MYELTFSHGWLNITVKTTIILRFYSSRLKRTMYDSAQRPQVQFLTLVQTEWVTLKEFDDSTPALLPVSDSAEELSLEEAQTRLMVLSKKYPFLTFRLNKVIR
jgi:hypothetical protein